MRRFIQLFFRIVDYIVRKIGGWEMLPQSEYQCFYVEKQKYRGPNRTLKDGQVLRKGDIVLELHLNNIKMEAVGSAIKKIFKILDSEMRTLSLALDNDPAYREVVAIYGRTVLYPITEKKGFETHDIQEKRMARFLKIWDNLIKYAYENKQHKTLKFREPKEIWISKDKLTALHLK